MTKGVWITEGLLYCYKLNPPRTILDERVNLPDGHYVSQHVTQPLWVHKIEVVQQGVFKVEHCAIVVQESHGLFQFSVARALADEGTGIRKYFVSE